MVLGGGMWSFVEVEGLEEGIQLLVVGTIEDDTTLSGQGGTSGVSSRMSWMRNLASLATTCDASFREICWKWSDRRMGSRRLASA